jgi:hypothetical protein
MTDKTPAPVDDEKPAAHRGPEMTVEGTLTAPLRAAEPTPEPLAKADDAPIELKSQPKALPWAEPAPYRDTTVPKSPWPMRLVVGLFAAGIIALVTVVAMPPSKNGRPSTHPGVVMIDSQPAGATVLIAGQSVGKTPWATDNVYKGEVKFELVLPGYQKTSGTFTGNKDAAVSFKLKPEDTVATPAAP